GGIADMPRTPAACRSDANDPKRTSAAPFEVLVQVYTMCFPELGTGMRRREFIASLAAATALPRAAHAQEKVRRVGVLMHVAADDAEAQLRLAAFLQGLQEAGWSVGRNVRIDARWSPGNIPRLFRDAAALVATSP